MEQTNKRRKEIKEVHPSRDNEGYPLEGIDEVNELDELDELLDE